MSVDLNQATTIYQLLSSSSCYALPLILAILVPVYWKIVTTAFGDHGPWRLKKVTPWLLAVCLIAFISGIPVLKWGEGREARLRRKALAIKSVFTYQKVLNMLPADITNAVTDTTQQDVKDIIERFPDEFIFIRDTNNVERLRLIAPSALEEITSFLVPLLDATIIAGGYGDTTNQIALNALFKLDNRFIRPVVEDLVHKHPDHYKLVLVAKQKDFLRRTE